MTLTWTRFGFTFTAVPLEIKSIPKNPEETQ